MNRRSLLVSVLLLACGGPDQPVGGGLDFSLSLAPAAAEDTALLQVALLKGIAAHPCETLVDQCLGANPSVPRDHYVRLYDATGVERRAIRIPLGAEAPSGQELVFRAEVGTDYRVVVEAISTDAVPRLVGTSCTPLPEGVRQSGTRLPANPLVIYSPYIACDPRIDP